MDWTFILSKLTLGKKNRNKIATIIDVGCGNSTHTFLEQY